MASTTKIETNSSLQAEVDRLLFLVAHYEKKLHNIENEKATLTATTTATTTMDDKLVSNVDVQSTVPETNHVAVASESAQQQQQQNVSVGYDREEMVKLELELKETRENNETLKNEIRTQSISLQEYAMKLQQQELLCHNQLSELDALQIKLQDTCHQLSELEALNYELRFTAARWNSSDGDHLSSDITIPKQHSMDGDGNGNGVSMAFSPFSPTVVAMNHGLTGPGGRHWMHRMVSNGSTDDDHHNWNSINESDFILHEDNSIFTTTDDNIIASDDGTSHPHEGFYTDVDTGVVGLNKLKEFLESLHVHNTGIVSNQHHDEHSSSNSSNADIHRHSDITRQQQQQHSQQQQQQQHLHQQHQSSLLDMVYRSIVRAQSDHNAVSQELIAALSSNTELRAMNEQMRLQLNHIPSSLLRSEQRRSDPHLLSLNDVLPSPNMNNNNSNNNNVRSETNPSQEQDLTKPVTVPVVAMVETSTQSLSGAENGESSESRSIRYNLINDNNLTNMNMIDEPAMLTHDSHNHTTTTTDLLLNDVADLSHTLDDSTDLEYSQVIVDDDSHENQFIASGGIFHANNSSESIVIGSTNRHSSSRHSSGGSSGGSGGVAESVIASSDVSVTESWFGAGTSAVGEVVSAEVGFVVEGVSSVVEGVTGVMGDGVNSVATSLASMWYGNNTSSEGTALMTGNIDDKTSKNNINNINSHMDT